MHTNFIFEGSTRYLTIERSERVRYRVEHQKIKFASTRGHVIFCLSYKHTNEDVLTIFPRFQTTFRRFSKIAPKARQTPSNIFLTFLNIFRRLPKTTEEDPNMFRSYTNKFKCKEWCPHSVKDKYSIFTARDEDMIFSKRKKSGISLVFIW